MDLIVWMSQTSPKIEMTKELMEKKIEFSVIRNIEVDGITYSYAIVLVNDSDYSLADKICAKHCVMKAWL